MSVPVRVETAGSVWLIDEDQRRYMRMPLTEQPRREEWSKGRLEDLVWHDFTGEWAIAPFPHTGHTTPGLFIWWSDDPRDCIWAPGAKVVAS